MKSLQGPRSGVGAQEERKVTRRNTRRNAPRFRPWTTNDLRENQRGTKAVNTLPCSGGGGLSPMKHAPCERSSLITLALLFAHPFLFVPVVPLSSVVPPPTSPAHLAQLIDAISSSASYLCLCSCPLTALHRPSCPMWSFCLPSLLFSRAQLLLTSAGRFLLCNRFPSTPP